MPPRLRRLRISARIIGPGPKRGHRDFPRKKRGFASLLGPRRDHKTLPVGSHRFEARIDGLFDSPLELGGVELTSFALEPDGDDHFRWSGTIGLARQLAAVAINA